MDKVHCDKCKEKFEIELETIKLEDAEKVKFNCPHCNVEYIAYYLNDEIKAMQHKMNNLKDNYNFAIRKKDIKQADKITKQMDKLKKETKKAMGELRNTIEVAAN